VFGPLGSSGNYFRINLKANDDSVVKVWVKMEFTLGQTTKASTLSLTLALGRGKVVNNMLRLLYPQERPSTHCIGGWVGARAGSDRCSKSHHSHVSIPRPSSP
jgi:hypothetical protein